MERVILKGNLAMTLGAIAGGFFFIGCLNSECNTVSVRAEGSVVKASRTPTPPPPETKRAPRYAIYCFSCDGK
eukprot:25161_1